MDPAARLLAVQDEHRKIFDAIRARDPDRAREAMRVHIENACFRVLEGEMTPTGQKRSISRLDRAWPIAGG